ncbi:MAG: hypothetical protein PHQ40_03515 [Anaerolineaceae bacterium]|nr:hypothetical protein [Anaerolineaceae bacterium]
MTKFSGPQTTHLLRENLQRDIGRHLYAVLASYEQLSAFEESDLSQVKLPDGTPFPAPVNLNQALLNRLGDDDLKALVKNESKRPQAIQRRLSLEFDALLAGQLEPCHFLAIKQIELLFAFDLPLETFRARAANQNHILLLLPGEKRGDHVLLFSQADPRFHRTLPEQLITDNHLWELDHA